MSSYFLPPSFALLLSFLTTATPLETPLPATPSALPFCLRIRRPGLFTNFTNFGARTSGHDCVSLSDYSLYLGPGDVVLIQYRTLFEFVVVREHFNYLEVHIFHRSIYSQGPQTADNVVYMRENLMCSSFFSMASSLNWRFHFDFPERVFGKNQSHNVHRPALGELVSNTVLNNSRSVMLSVKQVHAVRARLALVLLRP